MRVLFLLLLLALPLAADTPVIAGDGDLLPAGKFAVCAPRAQAGPVTIRNLDSGATVADLGVSTLLPAIAVSPEGDWLVLATGDQLQAFRFTTATRTGQAAFPGARALAASPDGKQLAAYVPGNITLLSPQLKPVRSWPITATGVALRFDGPSKVVLDGEDGTAHAWDLNGKEQPGGAAQPLPSPAAPSGRTTFTSQVYDTPERLYANTANPGQLWRFGASAAVINATALAVDRGLSPDGKTILIWREKQIEALDPTSGTRRWAVPLPGQLPTEEALVQPRAVWSADGKKVAIGAKMVPASTLVLDVASGRPVSSIPGLDWILSTDGKLALGTGQTGQLRFVNTVTLDGQNVKGVPNTTHAAFAPDGELIVLHGNEGFLLLQDGQVQAQKVFKKPVVAGVPVWSPDGLRCAMGAFKGTSHILDLVKRDLVEIKVPSEVGDFRWSPDGRWLVSTGGPVTGLWQVTPREFKLIKQFRFDLAPDVTFSSDSRRLLVNRSRDLEIRSLPDGQLLGRLQAFGDKDWLVYTPDGHYDGTEGGIAKLGLRGATLADYTPAAQRAELRKPGLLGSLLRVEP